MKVSASSSIGGATAAPGVPLLFLLPSFLLHALTYAGLMVTMKFLFSLNFPGPLFLAMLSSVLPFLFALAKLLLLVFGCGDCASGPTASRRTASMTTCANGKDESAPHIHGGMRREQASKHSYEDEHKDVESSELLPHIEQEEAPAGAASLPSVHVLALLEGVLRGCGLGAMAAALQGLDGVTFALLAANCFFVDIAVFSCFNYSVFHLPWRRLRAPQTVFFQLAAIAVGLWGSLAWAPSATAVRTERGVSCLFASLLLASAGKAVRLSSCSSTGGGRVVDDAAVTDLNMCTKISDHCAALLRAVAEFATLVFLTLRLEGVIGSGKFVVHHFAQERLAHPGYAVFGTNKTGFISWIGSVGQTDYLVVLLVFCGLLGFFRAKLECEEVEPRLGAERVVAASCFRCMDAVLLGWGSSWVFGIAVSRPQWAFWGMMLAGALSLAADGLGEKGLFRSAAEGDEEERGAEESAHMDVSRSYATTDDRFELGQQGTRTPTMAANRSEPKPSTHGEDAAKPKQHRPRTPTGTRQSQSASAAAARLLHWRDYATFLLAAAVGSANLAYVAKLAAAPAADRLRPPTSSGGVSASGEQFLAQQQSSFAEAESEQELEKNYDEIGMRKDGDEGHAVVGDRGGDEDGLADEQVGDNEEVGEVAQTR
mmetsp:Transcript_9882/g.24432  ORF Transcript_9882/g.24432 Transcript_9882/m.24432 type:complete len:654 (+) Transcript_9882:2292-4253(+)